MPTDIRAVAHATLVTTVTPWLEHAGFDSPTIAAEYLDDLASTAAAELSTRPGLLEDLSAVVDLEPGNGFRYITVLTRLAEPYPLDGDLVVALPEFGKSMVIMANGFHVPGYVDEKMKLGPADAAVIATFTTLVSDRLA